MDCYDITIGGVKRSLPIVPLSDTVSIAAFVIFGDTEIVEPCARALAERLPPADYLITAEAKSIPLIYEMAKVMKMPRYIIARKSVKGYMAHPIVTRVKSITTDKEQMLCLDESDVKLLKGARVAIVDDVISTGGSIAAVEHLVTEAGGTVVARAAILAEGDAADRKDILYLERIPLFVK
ncbi:MAG: phosphoribosyltransferase family protein [Angelakisella sp.]